jgi:hypothetical protein
MPQFCTVCRSPSATKIDDALLAGVAIRVLSRRHGLSRQSLARHKENHIGKPLQAAVARDEARAERLLLTFEGLLADARRLQRKAELEKNYSVALAGISTICRLLELAVAHRPKEKEKEQVVNVTFGPRGAQVEVVRASPLGFGSRLRPRRSRPGGPPLPRRRRLHQPTSGKKKNLFRVPPTRSQRLRGRRRGRARRTSARRSATGSRAP